MSNSFHQQTPFASYSFNSQEQTPLRRRENDSFASPSRDVSDLPFYPPHRRRRRSNDSDRIVKYAMKCVLLSPLFVLVLWSVGTLLFTSKHMTQQQMTTLPRASRGFSRRKTEGKAMGRPPRGTSNGPVMKMPLEQQSALIGQQQQQVAMGQNAVIVQAAPEAPLIVQPDSLMQQQEPNLVQQAVQKQATMGQNSIIVRPPVGTSNQQQLIVQPGTLMQQEPNPVQQSTGNDQPLPFVVPLGRSNNLRQRRQEPKTVIYYYDPRQVQGYGPDVRLPNVVYDTQGQPVPLSQVLDNKQLYWQPPPHMTMIHPSHNSTNATKLLNVTFDHPNVYEPHKKMTLGTTLSKVDPSYSWGESTSTDQSIIICTVGVMALLVGALSARRLRARSILSACIENESLQDDVAYDTAYTLQSDSYNTFGGWKQDLEKFDV